MINLNENRQIKVRNLGPAERRAKRPERPKSLSPREIRRKSARGRNPIVNGPPLPQGRFRPPFVCSSPVSWPSTPCPRAPRLSPSKPHPSKWFIATVLCRSNPFATPCKPAGVFIPPGYIHIHNNQFKVLVGVTFPWYPTNYVLSYPVWMSIRMR